MKLEYEKNIRIMNDLMGYCHFLGAYHMQVEFSLENDQSTITLKADVPNITEKQAKEMEELLNIPRQREVEQNYWNISGEEEISAEMNLAAMMIDNAKVQLKGQRICIWVQRLRYSNEE